MTGQGSSLVLGSLIDSEDKEGIIDHVSDIIDMHVKADALITAVKLQKTRSVAVLLECGCDPFLKGSLGRTALYWSVRNDDPDLLMLMIKDITDDIATGEVEDWVEEVKHCAPTGLMLNHMVRVNREHAQSVQLGQGQRQVSRTTQNRCLSGERSQGATSGGTTSSGDKDNPTSGASIASTSGSEGRRITRLCADTAQLELAPRSRDRTIVRVRRAINEALYEAAALGSVRCLRALLACGGNPNEFFYHDDEFLSWSTPLIAACYARFSSRALCSEAMIAEVVRTLVDHGADVLHRNCNSDTPLHWAAASALYDTTVLLLRHGADVNACNNMAKTPLITASEEFKPNNTDVARVLLQWGATVNAIDCDQWNALYYAAATQNAPLVKLLLTHGAITDIPCPPTHPVHQTALFFASALDSNAICQLLIQAGSSVTALCGITGSYEHPNTPFENLFESGKYDLALLCATLAREKRAAMAEYVSVRMREIGVSELERDVMETIRETYDILSRPLSLKRGCRVKIRSVVGGNGTKYSSLPLPSYLINYLQLSEL